MSETAYQILVYLCNRSGADERVQYTYSSDINKKSKEVHAIDELEELGYIVKLAPAIGFCVCRITSSGFVAAES